MLFLGAKLSLLNFIVKLLHLKVLNKWSNKSLDLILDLLKEAFLEGAHLPNSSYEAKRMLKDLGLGNEIIHACKYDCCLFWKENESRDKCPVCGESRYKSDVDKGKKVPQKVLRYFPLITTTICIAIHCKRNEMAPRKAYL